MSDTVEHYTTSTHTCMYILSIDSDSGHSEQSTVQYLMLIKPLLD